MRVKAFASLLGVAGVVLGLAPAVAGAASTVYVNSYSAANSGATAIVSSAPLSTGVHYTVTVTGTFSAWTHWPSTRCGRVEPAPIYASGGRPDSPVGDDAEFTFAKPAYVRGACARPLPAKLVVFQFRDGAGPWYHPVPVGGAPRRPSRGHVYTYDVVGTGAPVSFRIVDFDTLDNNGRLRIDVTP